MKGKIVPVPSFDNPGWHFHVDPITVECVDSAAEVCDSSIAGVERALNEVGSSVLPDFRWCLCLVLLPRLNARGAVATFTNPNGRTVAVSDCGQRRLCNRYSNHESTR